ncbi:conserved hypothetical protein [Candida tropicalis MYA-3404]|uniref:Uncharacterized protein n=1 Tax=Candida tropicalis (strain ATCC MYA-3404 / T1) TaxID=294747 RepID=C5MB92_CANTT|nr:conserved hypothetical protein [Candida tropicalis MYA-3404]EER32909.1 conserved hypothetical protein [Candida tropicalis MYA-3404]
MTQKSKFGWFSSMFNHGGNSPNGGGGGGGAARRSNSHLLASGGAAAAGVGAGTFSRLDRSADDLERQAGNGTNTPGGYGSMSNNLNNNGRNYEDSEDDFVYRGVTNSNNLDSIFRSSGRNTSSNARNSTLYKSTRSNSLSGTNSQPTQSIDGSENMHTRMNSYGHPLAHPDDFNFNEESKPITRGGDISSSEYNDDDMDDESDGEFHPSDYDSFIMPGDERTGNIFGDGNDVYGSNNSLSRFREDV